MTRHRLTDDLRDKREKQRRVQVQRQRDAINREMSAAKRAAGLNRDHRDRQAARDAETQYKLMPRDTRDLTGVIFGDPIPGDPRRYWLQGSSR